MDTFYCSCSNFQVNKGGGGGGGGGGGHNLAEFLLDARSEMTLYNILKLKL